MRISGMLMLLVGLLLAACSGGSTDSDKNRQGDADVVADGEAADGEGSDLAAETGGPGEPKPAKVLILVDPVQPAYKVGDKITLSYEVQDEAGKPMADASVADATFAPEPLVDVVDPVSFKFLAEGAVDVTACVDGFPEVCGTTTLWCDVTGPKVTLLNPARGAMLTGEKTLLVTGKAEDTLGSIAEVQVNGQVVATAPDGSFSAPMTSVQGLNLVDVTATDLFGNEGRSTRSYLFSDAYFPVDAAQPALALVPDALKAWLDDLFFYNPDTGAADNLTYLFQVVLADLDVGALIPNPVAEDQDLSVVCLWGTYDIFLDNISYDTPEVALQPVDGGLTLHVVLPTFKGDFSLVTDAWGCADYSGSFSATGVVADAKINISASPTGDLLVEVVDTKVEFFGLDINLGGLPGTLLNWLFDLLGGTVANLLENEFNKQVGEMVEGLTGSLTELLAEPIELPLDPFVPGNDPVLLQLFLRFYQADFAPAGAELSADLSITAARQIDIEAPGAIARAHCLAEADESFQFDKTNPADLELAAHIDLVNEALFSLWTNGGLHLHVTSEALAEMGTDVGKYGVVDLLLDTAPLLPPVLTTCNEAGELTAQLGDFYVEADFSMFGVPADIHMYLFLELAANLAAIDGENGKEIAVEVGDPHFVIVDIASVNAEWKGKEHVLTGLITDTLVPMLLKSLKEEPLSFALPGINLGGLLGAPEEGAEPGPLADKELAIVIDELLNVLGYVHLKGGIAVQDAPPPAEEEPQE